MSEGSPPIPHSKQGHFKVRSCCPQPINRFIPNENKAGIILNKTQEIKI